MTHHRKLGKIVIAPDKFKGSLSAAAAARAMAAAARRVDPHCAIEIAPMADGGEGTLAALVAATHGETRTVTVLDPLGRPIAAEFGLLGAGASAVIEMAAAAGLARLSAGERNPERTSTFGVGELMLAAAAAGAKTLIIGIGGSATNDGGAGLAAALGYRLVDAQGAAIEPTGGGLSRLDRIIPPERHPLDGLSISAACDVTNSLCGPNGASAIYGPQKGASPRQVERLDENLERLAAMMKRDLGVDIKDTPGAGAAGGLGAGLIAFAGAKLERGIDLVMRAAGLAETLKGAELCLTGEGSIDGSSGFGKTVSGVAETARAQGASVLAFAGKLGPGAESVLAHGVDAYFSICPGPMPVSKAMSRAEPLLESAVEQALRAYLAGRRHVAQDQ